MAVNIRNYKLNKHIVKEFPLIIELMKNSAEILKPYRKYKSVNNVIVNLNKEINSMKINYIKATKELDND